MAFVVFKTPSSSRARSRRTIRFNTGGTSTSLGSKESRKSVSKYRSCDSQRSTLSKDGFGSIYELHMALDKWTGASDLEKLKRWAHLPKKYQGLDSCMTFDEVVEAGVLSRDRATKYKTELARERRRSPASRRSSKGTSDVMTVWELCDLVARPDFKFSGMDMSPAASDDSDSDDNGNASPPDLERAETLILESSFIHQKRRTKAMQKLKRGVNKMNICLRAIGDAEGSPTPSSVKSSLLPRTPTTTPMGAITSNVMPQATPDKNRVREPLIVVQGHWNLDCCDGIDSAQNPQVQLQTTRRTLLTAELAARGPCGNTIQIWVLRGCRWGLRRPKLATDVHFNVTFSPGKIGIEQDRGIITKVHTGGQAEEVGAKAAWKIMAVNGQRCESFTSKLFQDAQTGNKPYEVTFVKVDVLAFVSGNGGAQPLLCECELPPNEVITIVLACEGSEDHKGKDIRRKKEGELLHMPSAALPHTSSPHLSRLFVSAMANDDDSHQSALVSPTFKLAILTRSPLAQAPQLLLPLQKVSADTSEKVARRSLTQEMKDLPSPRSPTDYPGRLHSPIEPKDCPQEVEARNSQAGSPRSKGDREEIEIDPEIIPGFAKLYLNAGHRLDERIATNMQRVSARLGRASRLMSADAKKEVLLVSMAFYNWKHWFRTMMNLGPSRRRAEKLKDYAREKRFGKGF